MYYGFDDQNYTIWVAADGNQQLVAEGDETNNVSSLDVVNSNPLANVTFSVWRDYTDENSSSNSFCTSGTDFLPGSPVGIS